MKRILNTLGVIIIVLLFIPFIFAGIRGVILVVNPAAIDIRPPPDRVEIYFFYSEENGDIEFLRFTSGYLDGELGERYPHALFTIDINSRAGRRTFRELSNELLGMNSEYLAVPVMIMNGTAYQGIANIKQDFKEAFLTAGHDFFVNGHIFNPRYQLSGEELFAGFQANPGHVTVVYFYRLICPTYEKLESIIEAYLPETLEIDGRTVPVDLIRINTRSGNNQERVTAFLDAYGVPDEKRMVPIMFTASGYYVFLENISELLKSGALARTDKLGFQFP